MTFYDALSTTKALQLNRLHFFFTLTQLSMFYTAPIFHCKKNYIIHQQLKDEEFKLNKNWLITPLHQYPNRVRAQGSIYWQARMIGSTTSNTLIKCFVGEDWIIQRTDNGELKIALYINSYHHFLPDSANHDLK